MSILRVTFLRSEMKFDRCFTSDQISDSECESACYDDTSKASYRRMD